MTRHNFKVKKMMMMKMLSPTTNQAPADISKTIIYQPKNRHFIEPFR